LNGTQAPEDANLLNVADDGDDLQPLQLGVDRVQTSDEVLEEKLEGLWQTEHRLSGDHKGRNLLAAVVHDLALVGRGVVGGDGWRRTVAERPVHKLVHAGRELIISSGGSSSCGGRKVAVVTGR